MLLVLTAPATRLSRRAENPILLFFGLIIIFLQRTPELPCADDLTGVDDGRRNAAFALAALAVLVLCPLPVPIPPGGESALF